MLRLNIFITVSCICAMVLNSYGQTIKIESGPAITYVKIDSIKNFKSFLISGGFDYYYHEKFNLSSNFGYYREGYKATETFKVDNLFANTIFDFYLFKGEVIIYAGLGGQISIALHDNSNTISMGSDYRAKVFGYGPVIRYGIKHQYKGFESGIHADYFYNLNGPLYYNGNKMSSFIGLMCVNFGYKFK